MRDMQRDASVMASFFADNSNNVGRNNEAVNSSDIIVIEC